MQKVIMSLLAGVMGLILIGCAGTSETIRQNAQSQRADVFTEIKNSAMPWISSDARVYFNTLLSTFLNS